MGELGLGREEFAVERIGAGIAPFDIVDAEIIEHRRDDLLVRQREVDAIGLRTVAQRGVEQIEALLAHCGAPSVFFMVVLASHSSLIVTLLRCMAT